MKKQNIILFINAGLIIALSASFIIVDHLVNSKETVEYHTVTFDTNGGSNIRNVSVKHGDTLSRPSDPSKTGYYINSWTCNDTVWNFNEFAVLDDITLKANWSIATYSITYIFNGGESTEHFTTSYNINSSFDIPTPTKGESIFVGWFNQNDNLIKKIEPGMYGDLVLSAKWIDTLVIGSLDETRGTVLSYSAEGKIDEVTVESVPINNKYHLFNGWYDENNNLLSTDNPYIVTVSETETTYVYAKYMTDSEEDEWNLIHGVTPSFVEENVIIYGMYPNSHVTNQLLIDTLSSLHPCEYNGYYYYNHEYYTNQVAEYPSDISESAKPTFHAYFADGEEMIEGSLYWFKVEPIRWKVIFTTNSQYTLLCEKLIDLQMYHTSADFRYIDEKLIYPNNYEYSNIRNWMNGLFLDTAFTFNSLEIINTLVDNSASTTSRDDNMYVCSDTEDKIFALSYSDFYDSKYGLNGATSNRKAVVTDYCLAHGAKTQFEQYGDNYSFYWTRSPNPISNDKDGNPIGHLAYRVNLSGNVNTDYVGDTRSCARPAMNISVF